MVFNSPTFRAFLKKLEVPQDNTITTESRWINQDLAPIPPERRTWKWWNFCAFWISDCLNVNTFMIGGTYIAVGCNWWQALIIVAVGYSLAAIVLVVNGRAGATYHIGYPVMTRSSFGIAGAYVPIFNRILLGTVWYSVQSWIGGQCVYQMLKAMAPSVENIPNSFSGSEVTVKSFLGFFLFSLLSCFAIWYPTDRIRHLFTIKSIVTPIAAVALFIWAVVNCKGLGPIVDQPSSFTSSEQAGWAIVSAITGCLGNMAAVIVNTNDFTRFSTKHSDIVWSQLITMPLGFFLTSFIGIVVTGASVHLYGEALWNPIDILDRMENRAAVFFLAFAFAFATLGTNLCANSIPVGADMSAVWPRYINQRRGGYLCAAIAMCLNPWNLLSGAQNFLNFLTAYTIFLSPITAILITDFYIVKKRKLLVNQLYDPKGVYWYKFGLNWRAYASYILAIVPNLPGFIGIVGGTAPPGADKVFKLAYFVGFAIGGFFYVTLNYLFPCHWIIAEQEKEILVVPSSGKDEEKVETLSVYSQPEPSNTA
ncbi:NCS1 nucleoside transporter family [Hesseltinella vesiculosa]|uniref:NCS1 nucleoside transporter family n=1 Tax=Hesseltinella vesiculosa TaxID=101127 RepID=A0A1X2G328_9FUNG|nr:NCS1 nucleoside transporter family [Hesseltinella vesiculosa]